MTTGPQQVNNGVANPRVRENEIEQNKLLEREHGQRLDTGTQSTPIGADKELETVGAINRAKI